jgi:hypothetical protein
MTEFSRMSLNILECQVTGQQDLGFVVGNFCILYAAASVV